MGDELRKVLGHGAKREGIGIPDPRKSAERVHATSVEVCNAHVASILGGADVNYIRHKYCVRGDSNRGGWRKR